MCTNESSLRHGARRWGEMALRCLAALSLAATVTACGGDDIDPEVHGYWIQANSSGALLIDSKGYGWGWKIDANGGITEIRYSSGSITEHADGPFAHLTRASGGSWEVSSSDGPVTGSYHLASKTHNSGKSHPFLTWRGLGETRYFTKVAGLQPKGQEG